MARGNARRLEPLALCSLLLFAPAALAQTWECREVPGAAHVGCGLPYNMVSSMRFDSGGSWSRRNDERAFALRSRVGDRVRPRPFEVSAPREGGEREARKRRGVERGGRKREAEFWRGTSHERGRHPSEAVLSGGPPPLRDRSSNAAAPRACRTRHTRLSRGRDHSHPRRSVCHSSLHSPPPRSSPRSPTSRATTRATFPSP